MFKDMVENNITAASTTGQKSRSYLYLVVLVATVGGFLFGFDTLVWTGAQISLREHFDLSDGAFGIAAAIVMFGALIGTISAAIVSDFMGRKKTMLLAGILFMLSAIGTALPNSIIVFDFFRAMGGVGIGLAMVISPIYIAEIAPRNIRGRLVTFNQVIIVFGAIIAIAIGLVVAIYIKDANMSWRVMFGSECVPVLIFIIGLSLIPESPRYLVESNQDEEAFKVLTSINGKEIARQEVEEIRESIELEKEQKAVSYGELLLPGVRIALIVGIGLAVLQQFSGGYPLTLYAPLIFQDAGIELPHQAIGTTLILMIVNLIPVLLCIYLVDKVGRRPLLIFGVSAMAVGHFIMAGCFAFEANSVLVAIILTLTTCMSNLSISPLGWVVLAELFPTRIRGRAMGVAVFFLYGSAMISTYTYPVLEGFFERRFDSISGVFIIFGIICILGVIFIYKMVPETRGKTLEQIANSWLSRKDAKSFMEAGGSKTDDETK
jgi:sugar porter (SP) family MFS transporter